VLLYRVFPWLRGARAGHPGHPLYVPVQGAGRLDNPEHYSVVYASDAPAGAVAEAFGWLSAWDESMLRGLPVLPASVQALATLEVPDDAAVCDLDDASRLVEVGLRPSQVVTRDRDVTQAWALDLYKAGRWAGVRWWSYYDPRWGSHGVWVGAGLRVVDITPLTLHHESLVAAAEVLNRPLR